MTSPGSGENGFLVRTATGEWSAPLLIAATGGFGNPHRPLLPGQDDFAGEILHAAQYRTPDRLRGQHVVIVGAGNSAAQIAVELARHTRVTLATRTPVTYAAQRPLGRDIHFWSTALGFDHLPIGPLLRTKPSVPVVDDGTYRAAIEAGRPPRRDMFTRLDGDHVVWADGQGEQVDTILLATGYRPDLGYLTPLGALDPTGAPRQRRGLSCSHRGLGYVGLEWQRSLASATLRGVGRDAGHVVDRLLLQAGDRTRCCAAARA